MTLKVAMLFREAGKAISAMPFLLLQPIWVNSNMNIILNNQTLIRSFFLFFFRLFAYYV
jgi:hypothetical protein